MRERDGSASVPARPKALRAGPAARSRRRRVPVPGVTTNPMIGADGGGDAGQRTRPRPVPAGTPARIDRVDLLVFLDDGVGRQHRVRRPLLDPGPAFGLQLAVDGLERWKAHARCNLHPSCAHTEV